jgi:hypothetical protein
MVDQNVGDMSSYRRPRAVFRATGVPSARGGKEVGLYGSFPEPERSGSPANGMYQPWRVVSPSCYEERPTMISGRVAGGQLGPLGERWLWRRNGCSQGGKCAAGILEGRVLDLASVVTVVRAGDV